MKQIIILNRLRVGNPPSFRFVMWVAVTAGREAFYANAGFESAWKDASGAEVTALRAGQVVERVESFSTDQALGIAAIEAELQTRYASFAADVANNPFDRYGTFWDGSSWTLGGVS